MSVKMKYNKVAIFGERCSGTKLLRQLVERNLPELEWDQYTWKHQALPRDEVRDDVIHLAVCRDCVSWSQSLHRSPWHLRFGMRGMDYQNFIRARCWSIYDDIWNNTVSEQPLNTVMSVDLHPSGRKWDNIIEMKVVKQRAWGLLPNVHLFQYSRLLAHPLLEMNRLRTSFGWDTHTELVPASRHMPHIYPEINAVDKSWLEEQVEKYL